MDILDIFSWKPEKELSIDNIKEIVLKLNEGEQLPDDYRIEKIMPSDANDDIVSAFEELNNEGKNVCFLYYKGVIIAMIGYKELHRKD